MYFFFTNRYFNYCNIIFFCFSQNAAYGSEKEEVRSRALNAGRESAMQYRELLQLVMHSLSKPGAIDSNQQLGNISRKIAQCVTELATAAEQLKDDDWVNPSDPNWIAENELLGAAKAIENAAKKLSMLKPRTKIVEGKVSTKFVCFVFPPQDYLRDHDLNQIFSLNWPCLFFKYIFQVSIMLLDI